MPLPKPSKMISKRFKNPKSINPFINPPPPATEHPLPHHNSKPLFPLRKWRLRVVCTDPDATDDSSADELDSSPSPCKRFIHEIFLPVPPSSLPLPRMPQYTRPRRQRQTPNSNPVGQSRKLSCNFRAADAVLQDMDALFDAASEICIGGASTGSSHNRAMILPETECEEEFSRFVSEFVTDIGENCMWEEGIDGSGMPQEDEIAEMLNLELDSEALTWINSLQRLP